MKTKTWAIYDKDNLGIDTVEAGSEASALRKFVKANGIADKDLDGYWAEELDA